MNSAQQQEQEQEQQLPVAVSGDKALLVRRLAAKTPSTHGGIPVGFYRADLLPSIQFTENSKEDSKEDPLSSVHPTDLEAAYVELSFQEGFPTLPGGAPFWFKMDYEPAIAYSAFQIYLEQVEEGPRSLSAVANNEGLKAALNGHTTQLINEWYTLYYWSARTKAHDIYREAAHRHIRAKRALYTEDRHFLAAEKLLDLALTYIGSPQFMQEMTPKTAIEALKIAAGLQRVSVGLPANGPLTAREENAQSGSNFEVIIKQTAQKSDPDTFDSNGNLVAPQDLQLSAAMDDPESAQLLQEIVIRMSATSKGRQPPSASKPPQGNPSGRTSGIYEDIIDVPSDVPSDAESLNNNSSAAIDAEQAPILRNDSSLENENDEEEE